MLQPFVNLTLGCSLGVLAVAGGGQPAGAPAVSGLELREELSVDELWAALDDLEPGLDEQRSRELLGQLVALGPPAARAALVDAAARPVDARRLRSLVLREVGDAELLDEALALLDDPDVVVRRNVIAFAAQVAGTLEPGVREAALARVLREDDELDLRRLAWFGLGSLGTREAVIELGAALDDVPASEQFVGARILTMTPGARELLCQRVQASMRAEAGLGGRRLPPAVLAELLSSGYGNRLAELPAGGTSREDRLPFLMGQRHHDPLVRGAAKTALTRFVARGIELGRARDVDRVLAELIDEGGARHDLWRRRAQLALRGEVDAQLAFVAGSELEREAERGDELRALDLRFEGSVVTALAAIASGEPQLAQAPLERAATVARAARGLAYDPYRRSLLATLSDDGGAQFATLDETYVRLALVELLRAVAWLAEGARIDDVRVLEALRQAHTELLRAQLVGIRYNVTLGRGETFDEVLLYHAWSPNLVLMPSGAGNVWSGEAGLDLLDKLCRACASIAPVEFPGFAGLDALAPVLSDPERDDARRNLLFRIRSQWIRGDILAANRETELRLDATRYPSRAALILGEALAAEGRSDEARGLALRMRRDLAARPSPLAFQMARWEVDIERLIGTTWTDSGEPERAEDVLLGVVERLSELESDARARGRDAGQWERDRAAVLVSLAVNANVKLGDSEKALAYFERAYSLRQDDFMTVLLACYRARAGRALEARRILAEASVMPGTFYNLACTHALLGDADEALDFLERDFRENHASPSSLERQQSWARSDPDLAALRDDPRFERLLQLDFAALAGSPR